jgi:hypothetical protein
MTTARPVPNLLVPGMQKSGTTFLCAHLARHPRIYFSKPKEPDLFRKPKLTRGDFQRYLRTMFPLDRIAKKPGIPKYLAEGTTTYFQSPHALGNLQKYLGRDITAIVCIRHPIDKAVSHYMHNWRRGRLTGKERITDIAGAARSIYEWGLCAAHAERWIEALGRKRLLFLRYELLVESPEKYVRAATDFLGIEPLPRIETRRINAGFPIALEGKALVPVVDAAAPKNDRSLLPRFPISDLEFLLEQFRADIERTEDVVGIDLAGWKTLPRLEVA